jgi:hypothetical protein
MPTKGAVKPPNPARSPYTRLRRADPSASLFPFSRRRHPAPRWHPPLGKRKPATVHLQRLNLIQIHVSVQLLVIGIALRFDKQNTFKVRYPNVMRTRNRIRTD